MPGASFQNDDEVAADMASVLEANGVTDNAGVRVDDLEMEDVKGVGEVLPTSRVWNKNGEPTDKRLAGTSTIGIASNPTQGDIRGSIRLLQPKPYEGYYGKTVYLVSGKTSRRGVDKGEAVIGHARVLAIYERDKEFGGRIVKRIA